MVHEDYLPCGRYEKQPAHAEKNFTAFFHGESQLHFFALLDEDGKVLMKSEGYPQSAARENGIQSVIKNRVNADFYSAKSENNKYFLSLRAANYREIARSCSVDTEAEALAMIEYCTGAKKRGGVQVAAIVEDKERANNKIDDDYLACREYEGHADVGIDGYAGLVKFAHANGQNYFAWLDDDGKVLMRSEGYPTTAARDNGMASVSKNRDLDERYGTIEKMGRHFVILKAGNHQEIARSCPYDNQAAALAFYPSARGKTIEDARLAAEAAAKVKADEAAAVAAAAAKAKADEEIALAAAAAKAKADEEMALAATAKAKADEEMALAATAKAKADEEAATVAAAAVAATVVAKANRDDDNYLACKEYASHGDGGADAIVKWQHADGEYYFTWVNNDGSVKMRSEGYPTTAARDNGATSVMNNRDNKDRYATKQLVGRNFVILKAGNHQEIARSCAFDNMAALYAMFPIMNPEPKAAEPVAVAEPIVAAAVVAAIAAVPTPSAPVAVDIEDDYLTCKEYEGKTINDKNNNVAMFKHSNGLYYFAIYDKEGKVRLRSEGFTTALNRDQELSGAIKNLNNPDAYSVMKKGEYFMQVLKDKTGKEVGRSCLQKEEPKPFVAPVALAAVAAAAIAAVPKFEPKVEKVVVPPPPPPVYAAAAPVVEAASSAKWPWLLLGALALGGLAWWMMRKPAVMPPPPAPTAVEVPAAPPAPEVAAAPVAPVVPIVAAPASCDLNWIFFDFDKDNIRADADKELAEMAKILKEHKDYVGVLKAHTDAKGSVAYNDALSNRRAANAKAVLVKMGIEGDRLKTTASGKADPFAKNTEGDEGRHYNRRVELSIQDKEGKTVCTSVPPAVPAGLKGG